MKLTKDIIKEVISTFASQTHENYGSYDFCVGYLSTMLAESITLLPEDEANKIIIQLINANIKK